MVVNRSNQMVYWLNYLQQNQATYTTELQKRRNLLTTKFLLTGVESACFASNLAFKDAAE